MAQISVNGLTFCYDGAYTDVFTDVSFSVDTSWRLGLVGRNGRGKTTLLRILLGELEYRGSVSSPVVFSYFPREPENPDETCEEILERLSGGALRWKILRETGAIGLEEEMLYRPYSTLSGGEKTKLLLATQFLRENGFPLIDEPTNHLDEEGREAVERYLASKSGFILVSHDRRFLDRTVDHIMSINRSGIEISAGNFSVWYENRQRRDAFEMRENERLTRDIARLESSSRQAAGWADKAEASKKGDPSVENKMGWAPYAGAKSAKKQKARKAMEKRTMRQAEEKKSLLKDLEKTEELKITPLQFYKSRMLEASGLSLYYGDRAVAEDISFTIERGDRAAVAGRNGSGKSTLLKLVCGEDIRHEGTFISASGLRISHVPQDASFLKGTVYSYAEETGCDLTRFLTILRKLDMPRELFERDMSGYSMGQKKKVLLAASLATDAHLYVWDEPLNYIDIFSRIQIEELLRSFAPTIMFVEHDAAFRENIANKTIEM